MIPPLGEQRAIVSAVEGHLARLKTLAAVLAEMGELAPALERACLASAFRGELVPQDRNDEPAEVMLARLKAANGSTTNGAKPKPGRRAPSARGADSADE